MYQFFWVILVFGCESRMNIFEGIMRLLILNLYRNVQGEEGVFKVCDIMFGCLVFLR